MEIQSVELVLVAKGRRLCVHTKIMINNKIVNIINRRVDRKGVGKLLLLMKIEL